MVKNGAFFLLRCKKRRQKKKRTCIKQFGVINEQKKKRQNQYGTVRLCVKIESFSNRPFFPLSLSNHRWHQHQKHLHHQHNHHNYHHHHHIEIVNNNGNNNNIFTQKSHVLMRVFMMAINNFFDCKMQMIDDNYCCYCCCQQSIERSKCLDVEWMDDARIFRCPFTYFIVTRSLSLSDTPVWSLRVVALVIPYIHILAVVILSRHFFLFLVFYNFNQSYLQNYFIDFVALYGH